MTGQPILAAIDLGFNQVKARYTKKQDRYVFPSIVAPARESQFEAGLNGSDRAHLCYRNKQFFLAEYAIAHSPLAGQTVNRGRVHSLEYPALFMASLAQMVPGQKTVRLVTGLPNSEMNDQDEVRGVLLGEHDIRYNDRPYHYDIEKIQVVPQAFGILIREVFKLTPEGVDVRDRKLLSESSMYVDIGGRTVNLMLMRGSKYIGELSRSRSLGMYRVMDDLGEVLNRAYGIQLSMAELDWIFKSRSPKKGYTVTLEGKSENISRYVLPILEEVAEAIKREAESLWRDINASNLLIAGGGAYHLGQMVAEKIGHRNTRLVEEPEFAVVDGMYLYSVYLEANDKWEE